MSAGAVDSALGWIGDAMRYFASWVPRPLKVLATHKAVKFVFGRRIVVLDPGFYWYIPAVTDVYPYPVVEQTDEIPVQSGCTKDLKAVAVGGMICYRVYDIRKAIVECFEIAHIIRDRSLAVYNEFVSEHSFDEIIGGKGPDDELSDEKDDVDVPEDGRYEDGSVQKVVPRRIKSGRHRVNSALTRKLRSVLRPYGVDVIRAQLTHFGPSTTLVHVGTGLHLSLTANQAMSAAGADSY